RSTRMKRTHVLSFICLMIPAAARAERMMTPLDIARLRVVQSASISPDGGHVAYTLLVPRKLMEGKDGPSWCELHVVDQAGHSRPYVTGEMNVENVSWTPDGTGIAFIAKRGSDKHSGLYVIPLNGGEARLMVSHDADIGAYAWRPDGKLVAFIATPEAPKARR